MLRTAVSTTRKSLPRAAANVVRTRMPALIAIRSAARWNSTLTPEQRKAALKERDNLDRDWIAPKLSYEDVKKRSEQPSPEAFLIDVREPDEVIQGSIPSSVNLPLSQMPGAWSVPAEEWQPRFGWPKPKRDQEIVFYCRSGKRSASASDIARRNGYTNIYNYEGSWLDWVSKEGKNQ
ncbi:unnamed protein product [Peniophora sp. CBMAI 1063]|nr:unnamed protein product [Peniophora sp. CBMAI 1063]